MAVIYPFVIILIVLLLQGILWAYARNAAYSSARAGVAAGRLYGATPSEGAAKAKRVLDEIGSSLLTNRSVSTDGSTPQRLRVRIEATALSMIPGISGIHVEATVSGPIERWTTAGAP
ncbi:pilus assembly protein [Streptomyces sp. SDr-06]|uniref:pilus assembly protein n=1 Tax=Streptomyces sp. SDr-06 TaxID=2267702 RepID=UPI000DEA63F8|nr:pilus assembly protein [Streptomyces sp. SDr-06]RCH59642.1 pilus assembly protein [Streptomyces sp. SDr-06]